MILVMKKIYLLAFLLISIVGYGQLTVTEVGQLPEPVSNNPVCEGFVNGVPYIFSFGGIDNSKIYSGLHTRSFRYNIETGISEAIPSLPDSRGKLGSAASRIDDKIYIMGGYYVAANGSEETSDRVHIYDIETNTFLADGSPIPIPTDDHVQLVYKDSLIYLITGWSDGVNIRDVQIYNPEEDTWSIGTNTPVVHPYRSFGASGVILSDTIFYFGGATSLSGFGIQTYLRKGIIDPNNPTEITWTVREPDENVAVYRSAATLVGTEMHWVGGSGDTYNFDGLAYNGSGGVSPTNRDLFTDDGLTWQSTIVDRLPMDLRGIAEISDTVKFLAGGMLDNQQVTDKVFRLVWSGRTSSTNNQDNNVLLSLYPNPCHTVTNIRISQKEIGAVIVISDIYGKTVISLTLTAEITPIDLSELIDGIYTVTITSGDRKSTALLSKI